MKLYSKQFSTQQKDRRLGDAGRYPGHHPGSLQVERRGNYRGESNAGPYPSAIINSTEVFRIKFHGVSEGEKRDDDFERHANLKYKFGNRHFWGEYHGYPGESPEKVYSRTRETESDRG